MSEEKCTACENSGLPIVFLFHGAVATDMALAPSKVSGLESDADSAKRAQLPALCHARYVLRSLRPGAYLHIHHEKPPEVLKRKAAAQNEALKKAGLPVDPDAAQWEVLRVLPGGALVPKEHPHFVDAKPFSCTNEGGSHIYTVMTYRLADAHQAGAIKVAVSGNLWDKPTRDRNKDDPEAMQAISIPMVLNGAKWVDFLRPDAKWLEKHVADFALDNIDHGGLPSSMPLARVKGHADQLLRRMSTLSKGHERTLDKGMFFVLHDAVGTAMVLSEISLARHKQGLDYVQSNSHAFTAASRIQMLKQSISQEELQAMQQRREQQPLTDADLLDAMGRPAFSATDHATIKKLAMSKAWVKVGEMRYQSFNDDINVRGRLPQTAKFFPYERDIARGGLVVAPVKDMAETNAKQSGAKMERLHKSKELKTFLETYEARLTLFEQQVNEHDDDRLAVLSLPGVPLTMRTHYNPAAVYDRRVEHNPGEAYMAECQRMLVGAGTCSPRLLAHMRKLLEAKPQDDLGWALRAMVANQQALFAPMSTWLDHSVNWLTSPDAKLDKAYDTFKTLITDDWSGGYLKAKLGWLTPSGIGLSFGLQGFLAGVTTQILAQHLNKPVASAATAASKAAGQAGAKARTATLAMTTTALAQLDSAEGRLATRINTWCHHLSLVLNALMNKQVPPRPKWVAADLTLGTLHNMVQRLKADGKLPKYDVRRTVKGAEKLPAALLEQTVRVEFLVTDADLRNAPTLSDLAQKAELVQLHDLSDRTGKVKPMMLDADGLQALYQQAHRYDALKNSLTQALGQGLPVSLAYAAGLAATPLRGALQGTQAVVQPGGLGSQAAKATAQGAKAVGAVAAESGLSVFGCYLQWRLHEANEARLEMLAERLRSTPGLSEAQRDAIEEQIELTRLGYWDNKAGMIGGVSEVAAIVLTKLMNSTSSAGVQGGTLAGAAFATAAAAFAGAAGSFFNAQQAYLKAAGKAADGDSDRAGQYKRVFGLYLFAGISLAAAGGEVVYTWFTTRKLVKQSIRGAAGRAAAAAAGRAGTTVAARAVLGLSFTGWGLVFTVLAVGYEGVVAYNDRAPLEEWVEWSYWGTEPKWRNARGSTVNGLEQESKAFDAAAKKAVADAATYDKLETPMPTLAVAQA